LENARHRVIGHGCAPWVSFEQASIADFSSPQEFDALVGRFILLYLPDVGATLRRLLSNVKPGGIVAFHDADMIDLGRSEPPCPLWDRSIQLLRDAFERAGASLNAGRRLGNIFLRAGLPYQRLYLRRR
jgi:hypothetical protein